ncbi:Uncharacterised protein [Mycobacteroides abscessus subsp. abscessus]|nr:Uncharacterised protein [Mycobacteroides abscessus subsp. abscessus]
MPAKCVGLLAPSSSAPSGPGCTVVRGPSGYICSAFGANTSSTPSARNSSTSASSVRGYLSRSSPAPNCSGLTKIETITTWLVRLACRTISRWPWCNAPMVGTSATVRPTPRSALATDPSTAGSWCTVSWPGR